MFTTADMVPFCPAPSCVAKNYKQKKNKKSKNKIKQNTHTHTNKTNKANDKKRATSSLIANNKVTPHFSLSLFVLWYGYTTRGPVGSSHQLFFNLTYENTISNMMSPTDRVSSSFG